MFSKAIVYRRFVTVIVDGKYVDKHVMSKFCKGSSTWESKKGTPECENWFLEHNCSANHQKSSGAMESSGAVAIFSSSVAYHCSVASAAPLQVLLVT